MPKDTQDLANQIVLAIKNAGIHVEENSFQLSSMIFGFKIVEKIVERQQWDSEVSDLNSGLFAELFASYTTVYGLPTSKSSSNNSIQIINSCAAISLYYHLLLGSFQDLEQIIYDMNRLLSDYFTNKISESQVIMTNEKNLEFLQQMFNINHFADLEISVLPLDYNLKRTYEKFKEILDATRKLCALLDTICETVRKDVQQVKPLQSSYEAIHAQALEIIQKLTKQYEDLRKSIMSRFGPIFEQKEFNDFTEYLKKLLTILSTISYVSILTAQNKPESFSMIQKVLDELLLRFYVITEKSINVMHFKGNIRTTIEEIKNAYNDVQLITSPLQSALVTIIQQTSPPFNYISAKRLSENFQELNDLLANFNDQLKIIEDTIVKSIFQPKSDNDRSSINDSLGSSREDENSLTVSPVKQQTPVQENKMQLPPPKQQIPLPENNFLAPPKQQTPVKENSFPNPPPKSQSPVHENNFSEPEKSSPIPPPKQETPVKETPSDQSEIQKQLPKEEPKKENEESFFAATEKLVLDLLNTEKPIDDIIGEFSKITQLANYHLGQFTRLINSERDEEMRALYIKHRSNVYFSFSNFNHSVNILQASKDNSCFRKYVAVTSVSLLLAQCTANHDPEVIVSLKKLLSILAVKNGVLFFQEKEMIVQILYHVIQSVPQSETFAQYIIQLCMKIIIDCESKIPKNVNPDSPKTIIPCIEQNYNIGVALNAISAAIHHDEKTQPITLLLETYSFIFTHFPLFYRVTAQLYIMQGTYEFSNTTKSFEFIFQQLKGTRDELVSKTQNSMKIIKSFIHNPPPAGTYDRQYMNDLLEAVHNGYKDSIVFFHASHEVLEKSNDQVSEIKKDINHLAESLKEIIRLFPFMTEISTPIKFEVPPIFSVIIKTDFLLIIQYFQMILSDFNKYSFYINEIISKLFFIAEYLEGYPSLKYLVDSLRANGDLLEKCGIKASLKDHDTNYDLQFAIKNIEEVYQEITVICDEFAQEVLDSEGKVEKAIELSQKSKFHVKQLLIHRNIPEYSVSKSKKETIEQCMSLEGLELIAELRDNSVDPSKIPDKYKGNDLSLAMQVGFRARTNIDVYRARSELSQEQNNFVQERIKESKSDDYHDELSGSLLSVMKSSDLRAKVNRDFNNLVAEYLIRKIADAAGEILEEQRNSSVIGVFLFQNSRRLASLLGLSDEQFEFVFNSIQMHQIKATPAERQFEVERICSNGLNQNRIKSNQLVILQNIVYAFDSQFDVDSYISAITDDELMSHNFIKDEFDDIRDVIIEMDLQSESAKSSIKYEDQKTYVGNKILELDARQQNLIKALTQLNKHMMYSKLTRLAEFNLAQIKLNEVDRIIESISIDIAKIQARISTQANCDFESHGIKKEVRTNIAIDALVYLPKQISPQPEPVQQIPPQPVPVQQTNDDDDSIPPVIEPGEKIPPHQNLPPYIPPTAQQQNPPPYVPPMPQHEEKKQQNPPPYVPPMPQHEEKKPSNNLPQYVPPKPQHEEKKQQNPILYVPPMPQHEEKPQQINLPPPNNLPPYFPPMAQTQEYNPYQKLPTYTAPKNQAPEQKQSYQNLPPYFPPQNHSPIKQEEKQKPMKLNDKSSSSSDEIFVLNQPPKAASNQAPAQLPPVQEPPKPADKQSMISNAIGYNQNQQQSICDLLKNHQTNPDKSKRKAENERTIKEAIESGKLSKDQERFNIAMLNASDDQNDIDNFIANELSDAVLAEKGFYPQDFDMIRKFIIEYDPKSNGTNKFIRNESQKSFVEEKILAHYRLKKNLTESLQPIHDLIQKNIVECFLQRKSN